jgi:hypothetical protein
MKARKNKGRMELTVPHERGEITFAYPEFGPGTYFDIGEEITKRGLARPTIAQTISLIYDAWQTPEKPFCERVIGLTNHDRNLLGFNEIRYVRDKGAYIIDLPEFEENEGMLLDTGILEDRIKQGDTRIRFVPFGYRTNYQTIPQLRRNLFIIKLAGKEGVKKLVEIGKMYRRKPLVWASDLGSMRENEKERIAAFGISGGGEGIHRVTSYFNEEPSVGMNIGSIHPENEGYAFGVVKRK